MEIEKFGALLWKKWEPGLEQDVICGFWAEDNSLYTINCPYQLRDIIVKLQHKLCDLYELWENTNKKLNEINTLLNKIF